MITRGKKFFWSAVWLFLAFPNALAFASGSDSSATIPNPLGSENDTLFKFITIILDTVFPIAGVLAVFFLIYAGFILASAGGNEERLEKGKQTLLWTIIGVGILLGAKMISVVICGTVEQLGSPTLSCPTV